MELEWGVFVMVFFNFYFIMELEQPNDEVELTNLYS